MQEERQLRRRQRSTAATASHATRGRIKIRSPALPFSKWEPPPYRPPPRDSPTDDGDVTVTRRPDPPRVVADHGAQISNHCPRSRDDYGAQTANHCVPEPVGCPAADADTAARHPRQVTVSAVGGVVVHRALGGTRSGGGRRRPRTDSCAHTDGGRTTRKADAVPRPHSRQGPPKYTFFEGGRTTRKAGPAAAAVPRPHPHQGPPKSTFSEPPTSRAPAPSAAQDSVLPVVCNYVDPAPTAVSRHDEPPSPPQPEVDHCHRHRHQQGQLTVPASTTTAATATSSSAGLEIGAAVVSEVREVKRMLRSFMAKLSQRDMRERNAFEWRIVALALDRLYPSTSRSHCASHHAST